jgi:hypothetical protein
MVSFLGVMRRGVGRGEADPSPTSSTKAANEWSYTSTPITYAFMVCKVTILPFPLAWQTQMLLSVYYHHGLPNIFYGQRRNHIPYTYVHYLSTKLQATVSL